MNWKHTPNVDPLRYTNRYVYIGEAAPTPPDALRVLKLTQENVWAIRWGNITKNRHCMPPDTPLEEVQAVAVALWRME